VQEICPLGSTWRGLESTGGGQCCGSALPPHGASPRPYLLGQDLAAAWSPLGIA